jgi:hypothetical protein
MHFKGTVLEGGYQLEGIIAADAEFAAFRVRVLGDATIDAVAHFYACDAATAVDQAAVWQMLRQSPQRNWNVPLGAGQVELDGRVAAYVVLRRTEERLSGVLEKRALRPVEAGEVLTSLAAALAALHERGLVHGCVSPEHVLATEDAILLSTESVRRADVAPAVVAAKPKYTAPETEGQNTTREADIWCLGATLFEAMTRKECGAGCREEGARLALPFGRIVQRCLEKDPQIRCKLAEVAELYSAGAGTQAAPQPAAAERPREIAATPSSARFRPVQPISAWPWRGWAYGAIAVLIAIAAISLARTRHRPPPTVTPVAATPAGQAKTAWPTRTLSPEPGTRTQRAQRAEPGVRDIPAAGGIERPHDRPAVNRAVWRVVLYTYDRAQDAEAKAQQLNQQHPGLQAESFSPSGKGGPYLVVAGGQMDRNAAAQLRAQVRRMGLPRDTYIQNFRR